MGNKRIIILVFFALLGICFFAIFPLFHPGFFVIHDDEQIARLSQMYLVLSQGQIPPRWIPDLGFGFGYPLFNFYPPLIYYIGSLFHFLGFTLINSTKIVMGLGFFFSATAMFVWVRKHYGVLPGLFAALLYTYAPYHSVDIYVRGALSEFFSWIWIPFIFWSIDILFEKLQKKYIFLFGIFFALLMLSHTLVMLQFAPLFVLYVAFALVQKKENIGKKLIFLGLALLLGLGLSAYFWIPSLAEKQYTLVDTILTKELANYAIHFVCPIQLWSGPWGYGGSVAGCVDGLSFQIGKMQIFVGVLGILLSTFFMFRKRISVAFAVSLIFLCSIFLTLSYSQFIWDSIKPFWYIQFPWRYLLFVAVGSAFLGGFVLSSIQKRFGFYAAVTIGIVISLLAMYQVRNYFHPQSFLQKTDADYTSKTDLEWRVSGMSYEYVPKQVATEKTALGTTQLTIMSSDLPKSVAGVISGKMTVYAKGNNSYLKTLQVNVYNQGIIQLNTYAFPGWEVFVDGKRNNAFIKNKLDLIQIYLPKGNHVVIAKFTNTPIRLVSNWITIVTILGMVGFLFWTGYKKI